MKSLVHLCLIAVLIGIFVIIAGLATFNAEGIHANVQALTTIILLAALIYVLYRWDKKRVENASNRLKLEVQKRLEQHARSYKPYELHAGAKLYLTLIVTILLGIGSIWFGYMVWNEKSWVSVLAVIIGYILSGAGCLQINRLLASPIVRIDTEGITHYVFGLIPWKQIIRAYLTSWEMKSSKQFRLMLSVQDASIYIARFSWAYRKFYGISEGNTLKLHLPVTEADAQVTEVLTIEHIKKYSPRSPGTKLEEAERLLAEVQELMKAPQTPENTEKLILALKRSEENAQAISNEIKLGLKEFRKKIRNISLMVVVAVIAFIIYIGLKLSHR